MFEVIFYEEDDGNSPALKYFNSLSDKEQEKILIALNMLEVKGYKLKMPHSEHIEDDIFCLRARYDKKRLRMLYFFYHDDKIIITNGFTKKTKKTPWSEIKLAKKRKKHFIERSKK